MIGYGGRIPHIIISNTNSDKVKEIIYKIISPYGEIDYSTGNIFAQDEFGSPYVFILRDIEMETDNV